MLRFILYFLLIFVQGCFPLAQNHAPVVKNVRFAQRTDGSFKVDIYYDLYDADRVSMDASMQISEDNSNSWTFAAASFSGDVGKRRVSGWPICVWV
jgi:hypothetical protein